MNKQLLRGVRRLTSIVLLVQWLAAVAFAQETNAPTIGILYFENNSVVDKDKLDPLKKGLADMLITEMSKIKSFRVAERRRIQSLVEEMNLGNMDLVDRDTVQKMGKLLDAKVLLLGGFSNLFGDKFRIDVRIVSTETGLTLKEEEETGGLDEFLTMLKSLVKKISYDLEVPLTKAEEDLLESTKDGKFDGYVTYGLGLNLEDNGYKLEKEGRSGDAASMYESARSMFQKAWDESGGYEPAKQKMEEMTALIGKMKRGNK